MVQNDAIEQAIMADARLRDTRLVQAKDRAENLCGLVVAGFRGVAVGFFLLALAAFPVAVFLAAATRVFRWLMAR